MLRYWMALAVAMGVGLILVTAVPLAAAPPMQTQQEYVVQAGDTLWTIAVRFGVTVADLSAVNHLDNPDLLAVGQRLIIPSPPGPDQAAVPQPTPVPPTSQVYLVQPGDTLSTIAERFAVTLAALMKANQIGDPDVLRAGQTLIIPGVGAPPSYPAPFVGVALSPTPVVQGQTLVVRVVLSQPATLVGQFDGRAVPFVTAGKGGWGLVGIHALQRTGSYTLTLRARRADGTQAVAEVPLRVGAGPYETEDIELAPGRESLLDPALVRAEQSHLAEVWSKFSVRPFWEGPFRLPLTTERVTSSFGTRRSYDKGPVNGFHEGIDFGIEAGTPIYAAAAGRVVLAEPLAVRGNAALIDHGLGVFSGYWHQSKLVVQPGQQVEAGQLIGYVGDTGLVTGAHLHWELRVGGIAVDPTQWTQMSIP